MKITYDQANDRSDQASVCADLCNDLADILLRVADSFDLELSATERREAREEATDELRSFAVDNVEELAALVKFLQRWAR